VVGRITYLRVATEYDLYKTIGNIDVCTEYELRKVKVPVFFLGTVGFSLRRDGRYCFMWGKSFSSHKNYFNAQGRLHHPERGIRVVSVSR
jgi:hypothetical protein